MGIKKIYPLFLAAVIICIAGCAGNVEPSCAPESPATAGPGTPAPSPAEDPEAAEALARQERLEAAALALRPLLGGDFPVEDFLRWLEGRISGEVMASLQAFTDSRGLGAFLRAETGESLHVLKARFDGALDSGTAARAADIYFAPGSAGEETVLAFGGDLNLVDGSYVMPVLRAAANGLDDVLTGGLLEEMRSADVLLLNTEFAFTDGGTPLPGKMYTFRAAPENAGILSDMGADIAYLANNHVFDYGAEGLSDTLDTLDGAGIAYIGAGMDLDEASRPVYFIAGGWKIAYVGAGCIERYSVFTPGAGQGSPGIFRADEKNADLLLEIIETCEQSSDLVVVNLHWGIESTAVLEPYQRELGQMCIDAGADAVIGSHPHVLQGAEFYGGNPIIYSTGNFWFSRTNVYTCLLELIVDDGGELNVKFLPCITGGGVTRLAHGDEAARVISYYEGISFGVGIDDEGLVTERLN